MQDARRDRKRRPERLRQETRETETGGQGDRDRRPGEIGTGCLLPREREIGDQETRSPGKIDKRVQKDRDRRPGNRDTRMGRLRAGGQER